MIVLALLFALQQSPLSAEADALMDQQTKRLGEAMADMSLELGRCAVVYPLGQSDPDVRDAREAITRLGQGMGDTLARVEARGFAEGLEAGRRSAPTVAHCAEAIPETAAHLRAVSDGLVDLVRRLSAQ